MPLTARSERITQLLPAVRSAIRTARLRPEYADDAFQQTLVALVPHLDRLAAMPDAERNAYAFVVASRTALALRKRVGLERARGSDEEVEAWSRRLVSADPSPEQALRVAEAAQRAVAAVAAMPLEDRHVVGAVVEAGLSERDAAAELGVSRGSVAFRLRRARQLLARAWLGTTSAQRK